MSRTAVVSYEDFDKRLKSRELLLVIKGTPDSPGDRYAKELIDAAGLVPYGYVNVFEQPELFNTLKEEFEWGTAPLVFHKAQFVGGVSMAVEYILDEFHNGASQEQTDAQSYQDTPDEQLTALERLIMHNDKQGISDDPKRDP